MKKSSYYDFVKPNIHGAKAPNINTFIAHKKIDGDFLQKILPFVICLKDALDLELKDRSLKHVTSGGNCDNW